MTRDRLFETLSADEGTGPMEHGRHMPYFDCCGKPFRACTCKHQGYLTIGHGHNIEAKGLKTSQAHRLLNDDIDEAVRDLAAALPWVADLDPVRQAVLVMMVFQMGIGSAKRGKGLLGFVQSLALVEQGDYESAAVNFLRSKWATVDSPKRALRLMEIFRSGVWP